MQKLEGYTKAQADMIKLAFDQGQVSRAQLADALQVSNLTVIHGVKRLLDDKIFIESGVLPSERGRRVTLLSINPDRFHFLCVDIGESVTKLAVVQFNGDVLDQMRIEHTARDVRVAYITPEILRKHMTAMMKQDQLIYGLCFSISGTIDYAKKQSRYCANLTGWDNVDFQKEFGDYFQLPVYLDSRGHCSALAQRQFGQGRGVDNMVHISVGSSICTGIILGGELLRGASGAAGELGHTQVPGHAPENKWTCTCGKKNCLEMFVPMSMICRMVFHRHRELYPQEHISLQHFTKQWLIEAYKSGDSLAVWGVQTAAMLLGEQIANMANTLNPQMIILDGTTISTFPDMVDIVRRQIQDLSLSLINQDLTVAASQLGQNISLRGAALLAISDLIADCGRTKS